MMSNILKNKITFPCIFTSKHDISYSLLLHSTSNSTVAFAIQFIIIFFVCQYVLSKFKTMKLHCELHFSLEVKKAYKRLHTSLLLLFFELQTITQFKQIYWNEERHICLEQVQRLQHIKSRACFELFQRFISMHMLEIDTYPSFYCILLHKQYYLLLYIFKKTLKGIIRS